MSSSFEGNTDSLIPENHIFPEDDPEEYDITLRQYLNSIATAVNAKDSGLYTDEEVLTGQKFYPIYSTDRESNFFYRDVYRKVIDFGALPNNATKSVAHGISTTKDFSIVHLYGAATKTNASVFQESIPIPFVNVPVPAQGVELKIDDTNINIITKLGNFNLYNRCFIVVEYIKIV